MMCVSGWEKIILPPDDESENESNRTKAPKMLEGGETIAVYVPSPREIDLPLDRQKPTPL